MFDLGIIGGEVYIDGRFIYTNVYCKGEKITRITDDILESKKVIDAFGKKVLPGLIDSHVHLKLNVGDFTSADDFYSGSQMAAMGGVTTIIDFLDPIWNNSELERSFSNRLKDSEKSIIDYGFHCTLGNYKGDIDNLISSIKEKGMSSVKVFTTYSESDRRCSNKVIEEILKRRILLLAHCEKDDLISDSRSMSDYESSRPEEAELKAIEELSEYANAEGKLYVVHVSSGRNLQLLDKSEKVYFESCPQYFYLNKDMFLQENGEKYLLAPPLRSLESSEALKKNIDKIDVIATDHCPFTLSEKLNTIPFARKPKGIGTLGFAFQLMYEMFGEKIIDKFTSNPARIFGLLNKGIISEGMDGDFAILDSNSFTEIDPVLSGCDYTAYEKINLNSRIISTIVRGKLVMDRGIVFSHKGKYQRREYESINKCTSI